MYSTYRSSYYTVTGTKLTSKSNGFKILKFIASQNGATKYDCLTKALGKVGTHKALRGYYSSYFRGLVDNNVVKLNYCTNEYMITDYGRKLLLNAFLR